jgi:hypothetical protein
MWRGTGPQNHSFPGGFVLHGIACFPSRRPENVARYGAAKVQISEGIRAAQDCWLSLPRARKCGAVRGRKIADFRRDSCCTGLLPFHSRGPRMWRGTGPQNRGFKKTCAAQDCWFALPWARKCGAVRGRKSADFRRDSCCTGWQAFPPEGQKLWRGRGPQNRRFQKGFVLHRIAGFPSRGPENVARYGAAKVQISEGIRAAQDGWLSLPKARNCGAAGGRKIADFKGDSCCTGLLPFHSRGPRMWRGTGRKIADVRGDLCCTRLLESCLTVAAPLGVPNTTRPKNSKPWLGCHISSSLKRHVDLGEIVFGTSALRTPTSENNMCRLSEHVFQLICDEVHNSPQKATKQPATDPQQSPTHRNEPTHEAHELIPTIFFGGRNLCRRSLQNAGTLPTLRPITPKIDSATPRQGSYICTWVFQNPFPEMPDIVSEKQGPPKTNTCRAQSLMHRTRVRHSLRWYASEAHGHTDPLPYQGGPPCGGYPQELEVIRAKGTRKKHRNINSGGARRSTPPKGGAAVGFALFCFVCDIVFAFFYVCANSRDFPRISAAGEASLAGQGADLRYTETLERARGSRSFRTFRGKGFWKHPPHTKDSIPRAGCMMLLLLLQRGLRLGLEGKASCFSPHPRCIYTHGHSGRVCKGPPPHTRAGHECRRGKSADPSAFVWWGGPMWVRGGGPPGWGRGGGGRGVPHTPRATSTASCRIWGRFGRCFFDCIARWGKGGTPNPPPPPHHPP